MAGAREGGLGSARHGVNVINGLGKPNSHALMIKEPLVLPRYLWSAQQDADSDLLGHCFPLNRCSRCSRSQSPRAPTQDRFRGLRP
ncbi:protein of unknown function [Nocardia cyriacigeorgica GUH-2]|uniref:Uncharacterized protein n=1 Tax=Nocardia cyriacigeorgica (strain GUH-2) TaxID=1127134 RepID=H6R8V6_NOCCG|nr:protein of unknown function [Nocardia cyriacigeorgica GUH-2]